MDDAKMQAAVDLIAARNVLAVRGLAKFKLSDSMGRVCARGALNCALTGAPHVWPEYSSPLRDRMSAAQVLLAQAVGVDHADYELPDWNNEPERTKRDVLDAFEVAASMALDGAEAE